VFQITNFPVKFMDKMTTADKTNAIGMSTADVFTNEPTLADPGASYSYMPGVGDKSPTGALVASSNYWHTNFNDFRDHDETPTNGLTAPQSVNALANFITTNLKTHYVFWTRLQASDSYYQAVLSRAKSSSNPLPATRTACPSNYVCM
jgi:hypothetical protein